jgi:hypothetical protein
MYLVCVQEMRQDAPRSMLGVDQILAAYVDEVQLILGVRSRRIAVAVPLVIACHVEWYRLTACSPVPWVSDAAAGWLASGHYRSIEEARLYG